MQQLVRAGRCDSGLPGDDPQVVPGGPVGVEALVEDGPDDARRMGEVPVALSVDRRCAGRRLGQAEQDPQCSRLAGAVGADEGRDASGHRDGGEAVESRDVAVALGQLVEGKG